MNPKHPESKIKGMVLVLLSSVCFGVMGMMIKALDGRVPLFELSFFRGFVALWPLSYLFLRWQLSFRSPQWIVLTSRGIWGFLAMLCYFWALDKIPLSNAVLLNYTSPIFTAVLAIFLLKEQTSKRTWVCLAPALAGLYALLRPSFDGAMTDYFIALGAGIFSGAAFTTVKYLTLRESPWKIVWYFNLVACLGSLPLAIKNWQWPAPIDALWLIAISIIGTLGQALLTMGFRYGAVSKGAIPTLFIVVVTTLGGWIFWGEMPGLWGWIGMSAIVFSIAGLGARHPLHKSNDRLFSKNTA